MTTIVLLGFGNVGFHLINELNKVNKNTVIQIYNRNNISLNSELNHIPFTTDLSKIKDADLYIIAIPDDSITAFSETLSLKNKLVVHTSGSVSLDALSEKNRKGVFYPLQTFSKNREVNFNNIPICVEATEAEDLKLLMNLGKSLSEKVVEVNSEERTKLHLAAVFVNNFVNHLYAIGDDILSDNELPFDLLHPLIEETASKIKTLAPSQVQTGPASRGDQKTIEKHLHLLKEGPISVLYQQLTESITKKHQA
ncbi:MAG: putative short-subunit dehydrogenase-like oxidoreductase (DUF2520 family) [Flavobacteriaceae bacterium]|jgi:predicted short-subunit dehydrogenase-like oxidoreductase (DUF2520 family)